MYDLEKAMAKIKQLEGLVYKTRYEGRCMQRTIEALQKENYSLKAKVSDLEQQIYLMNYKPKQ